MQSLAVWRVVHDITEDDLEHLDTEEGFRLGRQMAANSNVRKQRQVHCDGDLEQPILAWVYFANPQPNPSLPNAAYKKLLVDRAKWWRFPEDYQAELEKIQVAEVDGLR